MEIRSVRTSNERLDRRSAPPTPTPPPIPPFRGARLHQRITLVFEVFTSDPPAPQDAIVLDPIDVTAATATQAIRPQTPPRATDRTPVDALPIPLDPSSLDPATPAPVGPPAPVEPCVASPLPLPFTRDGRLDTPALVDVLDTEGLTDPARRPLLLRGIPAPIVSRLRHAARPFDQLLADLHALEGQPPADGRALTATYCRNAARLLGPRTASAWLDAIARVLDTGGLTGTPHRPPLVWIPAPCDAPRAPAAPLLMTSTPITVAHFAAAMTDARGLPAARPAADTAADTPIVGVDVRAIRRYCDALSIADDLEPVYGGGPTAGPTADGYRLPTEHEWIHACRAGASTAWWFGDDPAVIGGVAWCADNSGGVPQPVARKEDNAWGLYDMHGNVWEWTSTPPPVEPDHPRRADLIIKGGSCRDRADASRVDRWASRPPHAPHAFVGFRVVRPA